MGFNQTSYTVTAGAAITDNMCIVVSGHLKRELVINLAISVDREDLDEGKEMRDICV